MLFGQLNIRNQQFVFVFFCMRIQKRKIPSAVAKEEGEKKKKEQKNVIVQVKKEITIGNENMVLGEKKINDDEEVQFFYLYDI